MSYWIKLFSDGTHEKGTDTNIARGRASWSRGRLTSMIGAILQFAGKEITFKGPGPYWQKDVAVSSQHQRVRVARRIGRQINSYDLGWALLLSRGPGVFTIEIAKEKPPIHAIEIKEDHVGFYLVATITNRGGVDLTVETNFHV